MGSKTIANKNRRLKSSVLFPEDLIHKKFPEGVVAVGGTLDVGTLYHAYSRGIFPWPHDELPNLWFCPEKRGVLDFDEFHVPESLKKFRKSHPHLQAHINENFSQIILECRHQKRPGQKGSWINRDIVQGFEAFYKAGYILSLEVRDHASEKMIGGIYGVLLHGIFSGESMFYKIPNASKLARWFMVEELKKRGINWMDIQMVTPVLESFGGKYIGKNDFLKRLAINQK